MPRLTRLARRALVQERQQQILHAAAKVFAAKGFAGATIRDIARAARVSEGSIYLYFKNKQDLLVHLPRQFMQPPIEAFQAASLHADVPPAPQALLESMVRNMVQVITQNRELLRVLFTSLPTMDQATRATYMREVPAYAMETFETYIRARQAAGEFRAGIDPAIAARIMPGMMMFFLLVQEIVQPGDMPRYEYEKIIPNVIEIFLHGIMTPPPTVSGKQRPRAGVKTKKGPRTARKQTVPVE
jgi:AcrR family transcriptional regulator